MTYRNINFINSDSYVANNLKYTFISLSYKVKKCILYKLSIFFCKNHIRNHFEIHSIS